MRTLVSNLTSNNNALNSTGKLVEFFVLILNISVGNNINEFFSTLSNDQNAYLNLPVLWSVTIDGVDSGAINTVLSYAGEKWQAKVSPQAFTKSNNILVAQSVSLPNESSDFTSMAMGNMGGFLPSYGLGSRSDFLSRSFSINFLETEMDIEHYFFRPWMIAIGIKGLIAQGTNLKASIKVQQYSNSGKMIKGFKFNKVFPTAVEGFNLNYENTDFTIKSITFACENYEQL